MRKRKLTRGQKVCAFIETYVLNPEGDHIGKPMKLEPFQRKFILDIYDNPSGTHSAYLSIARKNGKTALIAAVLLAHLVGPEAVQNSQIVSGAQSKEQAAVVFELAPSSVPAPNEPSADCCVSSHAAPARAAATASAEAPGVDSRLITAIDVVSRSGALSAAPVRQPCCALDVLAVKPNRKKPAPHCCSSRNAVVSSARADPTVVRAREAKD